MRSRSAALAASRIPLWASSLVHEQQPIGIEHEQPLKSEHAEVWKLNAK